MSPVAFPVTDVHCEEIRWRRRQVRARPDVNGIDYVEVGGANEVVLALLKEAVVQAENVTIDGKPSIEKVLQREKADPPTTVRLKIQADAIADCQPHRLRLLVPGESPGVLPGFDPHLSEAEFSFGVNQETKRDLPTAPPCPPPKLDEPEMHYLAKDYASFRQIVLDRLALIMPQWRERHEPDLGITLVELLAYVGDYLSYYQDAVATEAYLDTARQRISVRRHARLVDYLLHEGCNARALLCLTADAGDPTVDLKNAYFITDQGLTFPLPGVISLESDLEKLRTAPRPVRPEQYEVFEPVKTGTTTLYYAHNRIDFYTWGERECCLPRGATRATLRDGPTLPENKPDDEGKDRKPETQETASPDLPLKKKEQLPPVDEEALFREQLDRGRVLRLAPDELLIFEEIRDPGTGLEEDADPARRHAVRLTKLRNAYDLVNRQAVLEIEWARADALPFPLCLSAVGSDCVYREGISVARGNVIVVDHGETVDGELPRVEPAEPRPTCDECGEVQVPGARRYGPHLEHKHVVYREALPLDGPVFYLLDEHHRDPHAASPQVKLTGQDPDTLQKDDWWPQHDLISSGGDDRHFVVEVDDERVAHLRFGDDELGEAPPPKTRFKAEYRVGEPLAGNVGAETIRRLIVRQGIVKGVTGVRNPLAAIGGTAPETVDDARLRAPHAFRQRLLRAITREDYARLVKQLFPDQIQRAFADLQPSKKAGRYDVMIWFDPLAGSEVTADKIAERLYPYRRIGHDITVQAGTPVPLDVTITVQIEARAAGSRVKEAIEAALGRRGFFCPDRLTFDTGISLSEMVAIAQRIPGVEYVKGLVVEAKEEDAVKPSPKKETWPDTNGNDNDLMTFNAGWIPSLGTLTVTT